MGLGQWLPTVNMVQVSTKKQCQIFQMQLVLKSVLHIQLFTLPCPFHMLTSSVPYRSIRVWQNGIYLLDIIAELPCFIRSPWGQGLLVAKGRKPLELEVKRLSPGQSLVLSFEAKQFL